MIKILKKIAISFIVILSLFSCGNSIKIIDNNEQKVSLSQKFQKHFLVGAAINEGQILQKDQPSASIIKKEFNTISPENVMKWMFVQPKPNEFYFDHTDKYVQFGLDNNMHIVGHALIWHSQIANFMNSIKDSTKMVQHVTNHISTLVNRYKGKIDTWDVVNEALNGDGTLRESIFLKVLGENYLETVYKMAEKYDSNADLAYNDYNLCKPKKREGAVKLIKSLQKNGAKINSVGIQAHWQLTSPTLEEIETSILAFSELGVKVMFTELDISVLPNPWELSGAEVTQNFKKFEGDKKMNPFPENLPDSVKEKLAKRYENIFKLFVKHKDKISRVTFWGVTDKFSWLNDWPIKGRTNYPLLFDRNYKEKKAYQRIMNLNMTIN
ncbi:MAG: endo-1,4-beta-xylanase [Flavobacteriaceae bacterium]|jgi:endo-1,4-beta-xylanase|tara:strand:- start:717 stop:1862 length:1146 start_codon:yes stop_codon:yes gene_type:complete